LEELETYYDDKVNHGRLYPNLDTLAERRFIEKFAIDNRSNGYRLTEKGNRHLQSRQQWEEAHTPGGEQPDRPAGRSDTANAEKTDSDTDTAETKADDTDTPTDSETADAEVTDEVDDLVDDLLADIEEMEDDTT
jgi:DNA-binding PadR family transcriptional regulator